MTVRSEYKIAYSTSLEDCHDYTNAGHGQDNHGIVVIIISNPETEAKQLEDVEWIQNLETKQS